MLSSTKKARLYQPSRHSLQAGMRKTRTWVLEFEPQGTRYQSSPLLWTGTREAESQLHLRFSSLDQAIAYAKSHNIPYDIIPSHAPKHFPKSYSSNFAANRLR